MVQEAIDEWQLRILYVAIYAGLGLINEEKLSQLNHTWALKIRARIRDEVCENSKNAVGLSESKFNSRFPIALMSVVGEFRHSLGSVSQRDALKKWRWLVRHDSDKFILRYIHNNGESTMKVAKRIAEGIVFQLTKCNAEQELTRGERYYLETQPDPQYIDQLKKGSLMIIGKDKWSAPLLLSRPEVHFPKAQSKEASRRLTVNVVEHLFMAMPDNVEGSTIIWDVENWKRANWDRSRIAFMIQVVTKSYPNVARRVILYKAPRAFEVFWKVINTWVTPVFQISFAKSCKDLLEFIPDDQIPSYMGGKSTFDTSWSDPVASDDERLYHKTERAELIKTRQELIQEFEAATIDWVVYGAQNEDIRQNIANQIAHNYWTLDPYVRSRHLWDRQGVLGICRPELAYGGTAQPSCNSDTASASTLQGAKHEQPEQPQQQSVTPWVAYF